MTHAILRLEPTLKLLAPHLSLILEAVRQGWSELLAMKPEQRAQLDTSAQATTLNCFIRENARRAFHGVADARIIEPAIGGFFRVAIRDQVELRFKKLDDRGKQRNYPTLQQQEYSRQTNIAGFDPITRVTVGYQPDRLWSEIVNILLFCPGGHDYVHWTHPLMGGVSIEQAEFDGFEDPPKIRGVDADDEAEGAASS